MTTRLLIGLISVFLLIQSCGNNKKGQPETVYKDWLGNVIVDDTIEAAINSTCELIIETKYEVSNPEYLTDYNGNIVNITNSESLSKMCHGWDGELGLNIENMILRLNFPDSIYQKGETIRIITRMNTFSDGMISKSLFYKIK